MTFKNTLIEHEIPEEVKKWLEEEGKEQEARYQKIVKEMKELDAARDQWYEEFFDRLKRIGFNTDGDDRAVLSDDNLPVKPDREHIVVY